MKDEMKKRRHTPQEVTYPTLKKDQYPSEMSARDVLTLQMRYRKPGS